MLEQHTFIHYSGHSLYRNPRLRLPLISHGDRGGKPPAANLNGVLLAALMGVYGMARGPSIESASSCESLAMLVNFYPSVAAILITSAATPSVRLRPAYRAGIDT